MIWNKTTELITIVAGSLLGLAVVAYTINKPKKQGYVDRILLERARKFGELPESDKRDVRKNRAFFKETSELIKNAGESEAAGKVKRRKTGNKSKKSRK
jgi:hypothetical protein